MALNAWLNSDDLIASIKRKISLPTSQYLFSDQDILDFCSEELLIAQVPEILKYHQEYFVVREQIPLILNQDSYPVPARTIGLKLRDVFWLDNEGNFFQMTKVDENDRDFFQKNVGSNQTLHKYYVEGNNVVLVPNPGPSATGSLLFVYYLRPNRLIETISSAIIQSFQQEIIVNAITTGDTLTITPQTYQPPAEPYYTSYYNYPQSGSQNNLFPPYWLSYSGAIAAPLKNITNISTGATVTVTAPYHGAVAGDIITIAGSNSTPTIDGGYTVTSSTTNTFVITPLVTITVGGSAGTVVKTSTGFTFTANGGVGTNSYADITTLTALINQLGLGTPYSAAQSPIKSAITIQAGNPLTTLTVTNNRYINGDFVLISGSNSTPPINGMYVISNVTPNTFTINVPTVGNGTTALVQKTTNGFTFGAVARGGTIAVIYPNQFNTIMTNNGVNYNIPTTMNVNVNQIPLTISDGDLIDFSQTGSGNKIFKFDVPIPVGGLDIVNLSVTFNQYDISPEMQLGDYFCPAGTCIIPQIPSDLHNGLAEKACARILASIGDVNGLQITQGKLAEIDKAQNQLLTERIDGSPTKVLNRNTPLRLGKFGIVRRM